MIIIIVVVSAMFLAGAAILTVIVAGVRAEERHMTLTCGPEWPRTLASAVSRRILGVYVRRPQEAAYREPDDAPVSRVGGR